MADVFVEVDEALKQEKLEALWKKYGGLLIGAIIAIILGTAVNAGYKSWKDSHDIKQTNILLDAIDQNASDNPALLSATDTLEGELKVLAKIKAAGTALQNNNMEEATGIYADIASDNNAPNIFKSLASYMIVQTSQDMDTDQKLASLQAMAQDDNNPWNAYAKLDVALLLANQNQDFTTARSHLKALIDDETAPETLRQKAQSIDILYRLQETKNNK